MSVERNLPVVRERKSAILTGDAALIAEQKKLGKLTARERVNALLDPNSFVELDVLNADAGVVAGYGTIEGNEVYVYAQDLTVGGGAVGQKHAKKVLKVMELAQKTGCPIVAMLDSAGAKLDEGVAALDAYAQIAAKATALSGVVPQIALILGPCGGTASVIAEISDITIQSKHGQLFVAGPLVVSAVSGKKVDMNEIAGEEASAKSGAAILTAEGDEHAIAKARQLIAMLPQNNLDEALFAEDDDAARIVNELNDIDEITDVRGIIEKIADKGSYTELYAEFATSMVTAIAKIGGRTVGIIANDPTKDGGRLTVYGCKKAAKLVTFCDAFSIPVVSFVDSEGMKISAAPQGELARAGASLLYAMSETSAPKVSVVLGNAIGMSYAAMASKAVADMTYAWPGAVISAVTTPVATQMLLGDEMTGSSDPIAKRKELEEKYAADIADGVNAAKNGYVDDVIEPADTRKVISAAIEMLSGKRESAIAKKHGNLPL
ncbi:MAG: methylmalonyl-CoA carboxyltransferase [Clostridia bacterium]|nr:methylmalonyl-CoA carboxyltransferase [Clostridia bacterium]